MWAKTPRKGKGKFKQNRIDKRLQASACLFLTDRYCHLRGLRFTLRCFVQRRVENILCQDIVKKPAAKIQKQTEQQITNQNYHNHHHTSPFFQQTVGTLQRQNAAAAPSFRSGRGLPLYHDYSIPHQLFSFCIIKKLFPIFFKHLCKQLPHSAADIGRTENFRIFAVFHQKFGLMPMFADTMTQSGNSRSSSALANCPSVSSMSSSSTRLTRNFTTV